MLIEVCDKCETRQDLIDICGQGRVLCRRCFEKEFTLAWTVSFDGGLGPFNQFVDWLTRNKQIISKDTCEEKDL